ncbi:MAG: hypothetical protein WCL34_00395 [Methylococcaceae bacterium]
MKTKFLTLAFSLMVLLSSSVFAGEHIGFYDLVRVETGYGSEGVYANVKTPFVSKCGDDGSALVIPSDHPLLKIMTAELMTAFVAGYKVGFYVEGCQYGRTKLQAVSFQK